MRSFFFARTTRGRREPRWWMAQPLSGRTPSPRTRCSVLSSNLMRRHAYVDRLERYRVVTNNSTSLRRVGRASPLLSLPRLSLICWEGKKNINTFQDRVAIYIFLLSKYFSLPAAWARTIDEERQLEWSRGRGGWECWSSFSPLESPAVPLRGGSLCQASFPPALLSRFVALYLHLEPHIQHFVLVFFSKYGVGNRTIGRGRRGGEDSLVQGYGLCVVVVVVVEVVGCRGSITPPHALS